jgi:hypothetical protein
MPVGKNCPNCGAPFDLGVDQCPYCGTIYFDMSCVDFTKTEPIFLKIRMVVNGRKATITQRVRPQLNEIKMTCERKEYQHIGSPFSTFIQATPVVTMDITFESVYVRNGDAYQITFD